MVVGDGKVVRRDIGISARKKGLQTDTVKVQGMGVLRIDGTRRLSSFMYACSAQAFLSLIFLALLTAVVLVTFWSHRTTKHLHIYALFGI